MKQRIKRAKLRKVITMVEMAALVGLSRSRFYELVKSGSFPSPLFPMFEHRAVYIPPQQRICIQVRRAGTGMNGKIVRFRASLSSRKVDHKC